MFKFLRKYNKWILAVGGTLLMITFLIPQAINALAQRAATTGGAWATIGPENEEVPQGDLTMARNDIRMISDMQAPLPVIGVVEDPVHWYLLVHEAEAAGLIGGRGAEQLSEDVAASLIGRYGPQQVNQTISRFLGVQRLIGMYTTAGKLSEQRVRNEAIELFHAVDARIVPILASNFADQMPEPSEEELQAQLDEYGDVPPGQGEHGFGYRLPDRVKIEWLAIPAESVRTMIEESGVIDEVTLLKHWRRSEGEAGIPEVDVEGEIPDIVRQDLLEELTEGKLETIEKFAYDRIRSVWRQLPTEDGHLVLPDDWDERRVTLPELARLIQERNPDLPTPIYEIRGDEWLTLQDLRDIEGLSRASSDAFGRAQRAPELIMAARQFRDPDEPVVEQIQARQTSPPLRTSDGSIYFFRILEADPSRPPASVDEVREQLVMDLKALEAYEQLKGDIESIEQQAEQDSLLSVAIEYDAAVQRADRIARIPAALANFMIQQGMGLQEQPSQIPGVGPAPGAVEKIIEHALTLPLTTPMSEVDRSERIFTLPLEEALGVAVVEILRQHPYAIESYTTLAGLSQLQSRLLLDELGTTEGVAEAFSMEAMSERHNFTRLAREDAEGETPADGEAPAEEESEAPAEVASGA